MIKFGLSDPTRIVADAEGARLLVHSIMREKFGLKLRELGFSCLFPEWKSPTYASNARVTRVLKRVQRMLYP
jgi:hypothetical protein